MATKTRKRRSSFGRILRVELDTQGVSIRELARRLSGDPSDVRKVENARRLLQQYVAGEVSPGEEKRELIAQALSIDPAVFAENAEKQAERDRLMDALEPLADLLLELATQAKGA
jgi:transcriptional regulator with XRE-family HTH domain